MREPLGGPYHLMLAALWAVEVADVFLGSIRHHGHLWRVANGYSVGFFRPDARALVLGRPVGPTSSGGRAEAPSTY